MYSMEILDISPGRNFALASTRKGRDHHQAVGKGTALGLSITYGIVKQRVHRRVTAQARVFTRPIRCGLRIDRLSCP